MREDTYPNYVNMSKPFLSCAVCDLGVLQVDC
jgi:hypothetical protein